MDTNLVVSVDVLQRDSRYLGFPNQTKWNSGLINVIPEVFNENFLKGISYKNSVRLNGMSLDSEGLHLPNDLVQIEMSRV